LEKSHVKILQIINQKFQNLLEMCNLLIEMNHVMGSSNSVVPLSPPPNLLSSVNSTFFYISFDTWYAGIRQSDGDMIQEDVTNISTSYNLLLSANDGKGTTPILLLG
jgi:hypothetical protein